MIKINQLQKIYKFVKNCVKEDGAKLILQDLVQQIREQKGIKYFVMGATDVFGEEKPIRYLLFTLPDDEVQEIENKITELVKKAYIKDKQNIEVKK